MSGYVEMYVDLMERQGVGTVEAPGNPKYNYGPMAADARRLIQTKGVERNAAITAAMRAEGIRKEDRACIAVRVGRALDGLDPLTGERPATKKPD